MLILAIDTALEACAVALLDTDAAAARAGIAGDGARPCRSADADDRARDEGGRHRLHRARPHRRHRRPRQLHRPARRHLGRARAGACRRQARGRRHHAVGLCRALRQRERRAPIISRSMRGTTMSTCRWSAATAAAGAPRVAPIADVLAAVAFRRAASRRQRRAIVADRWPADMPQPARSSSSRRPTSPGWRGSASPPIPPSRSRGRSICARPTPSRRADPLPHSAAARAMMGWLSRCWQRRHAGVEPATLRDAARLSQLHRASFHRGWGEGEFETMLSERNTLAQRLHARPHADRLHRLAHGGGRSRNPSVAVDAGQRGRGLSRNLLLTISAISPATASAVFLEVEENNAPARRLYERAGFARRPPRTVLSAARRGTVERPCDAARLVLSCKQWQNSRRSSFQGPAIDDRVKSCRASSRVEGRPASRRAAPPPACA